MLEETMSDEVLTKKDGEQPIDVQTECNGDESEHLESMAQDDLQIGSPIKKFKNIEALLKGYSDLEKEFTKKCQMIKELEQKMSAGENASQKENVAPQYTLGSWKENVKDFFHKNPTAKQFVSEISEVLLSDKDVACSNNSLEVALSKVLADKYRSEQDMIADERFVSQYVLTNQAIREKIVQNYLTEILTGRTVPLMAEQNGGNVIISPKNKPKNLSEASAYAEALLKL